MTREALAAALEALVLTTEDARLAFPKMVALLAPHTVKAGPDIHKVIKAQLLVSLDAIDPSSTMPNGMAFPLVAKHAVPRVLDVLGI